MLQLAGNNAVCLVAANAVALITSGIALMAVIFSRGEGFAAAVSDKLPLYVAAAGVGLTLLLLLVAAIRRERPWSGYLSAIMSLVLFSVVGYFVFS